MSEKFRDWSGSEWTVHESRQCRGQFCAIHNPSEHSMRAFPMLLRADRSALVERICWHGVGHPDPDSVAFFLTVDPTDRGAWGVHGCDGCCRET
jgi:hypothetical protein